MVLLAWISNPAVVETVMEKVEAYKDEAVREVLEDNKRLFSMLQNHRAATNNDKEWKDLIDRNQDVFNRLKDK